MEWSSSSYLPDEFREAYGIGDSSGEDLYSSIHEWITGHGSSSSIKPFDDSSSAPFPLASIESAGLNEDSTTEDIVSIVDVDNHIVQTADQEYDEWVGADDSDMSGQLTDSGAAYGSYLDDAEYAFFNNLATGSNDDDASVLFASALHGDWLSIQAAESYMRSALKTIEQFETNMMHAFYTVVNAGDPCGLGTAEDDALQLAVEISAHEQAEDFVSHDQDTEIDGAEEVWPADLASNDVGIAALTADLQAVAVSEQYAADHQAWVEAVAAHNDPYVDEHMLSSMAHASNPSQQPIKAESGAISEDAWTLPRDLQVARSLAAVDIEVLLTGTTAGVYGAAVYDAIRDWLPSSDSILVRLAPSMEDSGSLVSLQVSEREGFSHKILYDSVFSHVW